VPEHDDGETRRDRIQIELRDVVEHIDQNIGYLKHLGLPDAFGPRAFVVVPAHDCDWSQSLEFLDQNGIPNVARVNNEIATGEEGDRLRP
jgi:hypothetical protein